VGIRTDNFRQTYQRFIAATKAYVPPGLRLVLGLMLIFGGFFGFLPILGFWMIPLGLAVAALDIGPLWRMFLARFR